MNVEQGSCVYITNALPDLAVVTVIAFDSGIYVNYLDMKSVLAIEYLYDSKKSQFHCNTHHIYPILVCVAITKLESAV